jgi:drug/metabolite transporter (DMT)-like permease
MRLKADITLFLVSVIWGSAFVAQRVAGQLGSVYYFNGARYLLGALIVLPFALRAIRSRVVVGQVENLTYQREGYKWMFIAGFVLFIGSAFQQAGLLYTTAGNAGFITSLYVVLVPIVLFVVWREKPHWLSIVAVILAGVGAFLLSTGGRFEVRVGDALEMGGALFWTFHVIVLGKFASRFEAISFSVGQLFVCAFLNLLMGILFEKPITLSGPMIFAIAYTAIFSLALCYTLQIWAQRHTPPADAALILSIESVVAVVCGWLILGEKLAAVQILGAVLIFIAVVLSQFKEWTSGKIEPDQLIEGR